jgi:hypothetical protein
LHQAIKRTAVDDKRSVSDWIVVTFQAVVAEREEWAVRDRERRSKGR